MTWLIICFHIQTGRCDVSKEMVLFISTGLSGLTIKHMGNMKTKSIERLPEEAANDNTPLLT